MWQQQPDKKKEVARTNEAAIWSLRGKLTRVAGKEIDLLTQKGWKHATRDDLERFSIGQYNPLYDRGEEGAREVMMANPTRIPAPKLGKALTVIKV